MSLSNDKYSSINDDREVSKYTACRGENVTRSDQYETVEIKWVSYYIAYTVIVALLKIDTLYSYIAIAIYSPAIATGVVS